MSELRPGDIVTIDFPGVQGIKRRPAVIVSSSIYHRHHPDVIEDTSHSTEFGARFYAHHADEGIRRIVAEVFEIVSFQAIPLDFSPDPAFHFQPMILRHR